MLDAEGRMDVCHHFDPFPLSEMENPFPLLAELREQCPVARSDQLGGFWVLSRAGDVARAAGDPELFSSNARGVQIPPGASGFDQRFIPIEIDPPQHGQFRDPIRRRFTPQAVSRRRDEIRDVTNELIDGFIERGHADLATELSMPLPAIVGTRFLGLPEEDKDKFQDWARRGLAVNSDPTVQIEAFTYFNEFYEQRIADPRDDIPSVMLDIQIDGRPIERLEWLIMIAMLFSAGLDTTAHAASHAMLILAQHPELRARLIDEPELISQAVEELLRYMTPLPQLGRTLTEPVTVGDVELQEGDTVMLNWMAANHDPERFPDPEAIRLDRPLEQHFAFGHGIHKCLGQHLARLELKILLEAVLTRLPDYRLDPEDPPARHGGLTRGISALRVVFTPGTRSANGAERDAAVATGRQRAVAP